MAEEGEFEYVNKNRETTGIRGPNEFHIMMRRENMSVGATNTSAPSELQIAFYKAVKRSIRPTNQETQFLAEGFTERLETIEGVTVEETIFKDRDGE